MLIGPSAANLDPSDGDSTSSRPGFGGALKRLRAAERATTTAAAWAQRQGERPDLGGDARKPSSYDVRACDRGCLECCGGDEGWARGVKRRSWRSSGLCTDMQVVPFHRDSCIHRPRIRHARNSQAGTMKEPASSSRRRCVLVHNGSGPEDVAGRGRRHRHLHRPTQPRTHHGQNSWRGRGGARSGMHRRQSQGGTSSDHGGTRHETSSWQGTARAKAQTEPSLGREPPSGRFWLVRTGTDWPEAAAWHRASRRARMPGR